mmetsp:Transcript_184/g.235  ORF Transcript_184/g.235 Transcript_184/m.235 type:complete len:144 (-) Transcript_184:160-591(-)
MMSLIVSCSGLPKNDYLSKSDPVVALESLNSITGQWEYIGQTEYIMNNHDPEFKTPLLVQTWSEERQQQLRFKVFDVDDTKRVKIADTKDLLGQVTIGLNMILDCDKNSGLECKLLDTAGKQVFGEGTSTVKPPSMITIRNAT